jgi:acetyl esterase
MTTAFARLVAGGLGLVATLALTPMLASPAAQAQSEPAAAPAPTLDPGLRPDVRTFLQAMAARPRPPFTAEVLAHIRTLPPSVMASADVPVGEIAVARDFTIPGPAGPLRARLYDARATRGPGPAVVFFHGGGFVVGSIDTHAALTAEMARQLDVPVITVDYRLAPENRWPAAPDDAETAARWIAGNSAAIGRSITGLILSGDSAGGNLAAVTAQALHDRPAALPVVMQLLLYPGTDHQGDYGSRTAFANGYGLNGVDMELYRQHYAADPASIRSSPLLANLAGLPPTLVVTAQFDPLRDEGRAYAAKLTAAGVRTSYLEMPGTIHGFASYRRGIPSAQRDLTLALTTARAMLAEQAVP